MKKNPSSKSKPRSLARNKNSRSVARSSEKNVQQDARAMKDFSFSRRFLSDYAIPLTRLIEAKLVSLQHKM